MSRSSHDLWHNHPTIDGELSPKIENGVCEKNIGNLIVT
jgi:hypothetical protein